MASRPFSRSLTWLPRQWRRHHRRVTRLARRMEPQVQAQVQVQTRAQARLPQPQPAQSASTDTTERGRGGPKSAISAGRAGRASCTAAQTTSPSKAGVWLRWIATCCEVRCISGPRAPWSRSLTASSRILRSRLRDEWNDHRRKSKSYGRRSHRSGQNQEWTARASSCGSELFFDLVSEPRGPGSSQVSFPLALIKVVYVHSYGSIFVQWPWHNSHIHVGVDVDVAD